MLEILSIDECLNGADMTRLYQWINGFRAMLQTPMKAPTSKSPSLPLPNLLSLLRIQALQER
jgi:hypothetical protein